MAYSDDSERIVGRLRASLQLITDQQVRAMTAAWVTAWDDLAPDLQAALDDLVVDGVRPTRAQLTRSRRLVNALALIESRLALLVDQSAASTIAQLRDVVDSAGAVTDQLISSMLPPGANVNGWARVDPASLDAIVERTTEQITKLSFPLADQAAASMRRELVRGMLVGSNPREAARRMVARSESVFNGGLARAMTIARTEMLDAHRAGAALAEQANADVLAGWMWVASLSERTCPACWAKHGTVYDLDEPGPLGHQNCRCARVPRTKSWRELGFDVDEPPSILPDAEAAFAELPATTQLDVLGPARFTAWRAGQYPMSTWAVKRSTPGWRDSWHVTSAPIGFKGIRKAAFTRPSSTITPPSLSPRMRKLTDPAERRARFQAGPIGDVQEAAAKHLYAKGSHTVAVNVDLSDDLADTLAADVSAVLKAAGKSVPDGVMFLVPDLDPMFAPGSGTGGYVIRGTRVVHINPAVVRGSWDSDTFRAANAPHFSPVFADVASRRYVIGHELGHVVDGASKHTTSRVTQAEKWWQEKAAPLLRRYGTGNRHEGYAEGYVQWLFAPRSPLAKLYRGEYRWRRR